MFANVVCLSPFKRKCIHLLLKKKINILSDKQDKEPTNIFESCNQILNKTIEMSISFEFH